MGERMFEVTRYEPPEIFVTSRRTGETYKFCVGGDGAVIDELLLDERDARRAAIVYLAHIALSQCGAEQDLTFNRSVARIATGCPEVSGLCGAGREPGCTAAPRNAVRLPKQTPGRRCLGVRASS